jgi:membrane protease YdiL (CAAX protease family)
VTAGLDSPASLRRRRQIVAATAVAGAGLLGASLSTEPDSRAFYALTLAVAGLWTGGGLASGPLPLARPRANGAPRHPVTKPVATGVIAFGAFYGAGLVARRIPILDDALASVLRYADQGSQPLVMLSALTNGAAEEIFFRGALYAAAGERPVLRSTAAYMLATTATRNPALVLASGVMGTVFGRQRRASGGIQASTLTHLTWSALMLRYLPRLFRPPQPVPAVPSAADHLQQ